MESLKNAALTSVFKMFNVINLEIIGKNKKEHIKKVQMLRYCSKTALSCIHYIKDNLEEGITEIEVVNLIKEYVKKRNLLVSNNPLAGFILVSFGDNTGNIHNKAGSKKLIKNDIIMIDIGFKRRIIGDYCSDLTRTFFFGNPDNKWREIWKYVKKAQIAGIETIKAGTLASKVDIAARNVLRKHLNGYNIPHSVGHGVKRYEHAIPRISYNSHDILKEGDLITIEPGWYSNEFGIRIEDLFLVTKDGYESISTPDDIDVWL